MTTARHGHRLPPTAAAHQVTFASHHAGHRPRRRRPALARFIERYGWRAYALPILTVVTIVALWQSTTANSQPQPPAGPTHHAAAGAPAPSSRSSAPSPANMARSAAGSTTRQFAAAAPVATLGLGDDAIACARNSRPSVVFVSISKQHVWMCQGARQVYDSPATTGETDNGDATPTGTWTIQSRETNRYLVGPGYRDYVHYWLPYNGDFGFHDATWQTFPFGSADYHTAGSNGCVHLPMAAVQWLYQWAQVGTTTVTIQA